MAVSLHGTEQRPTTICKPLLASVSSNDVGLAVVMTVSAARASDPGVDQVDVALDGVAGHDFGGLDGEADAEPAATEFDDEVPALTSWPADVVPVKLANVPSPAPAMAAAPGAPSESKTFVAVARDRRSEPLWEWRSPYVSTSGRPSMNSSPVLARR